MVPRDSVHRRGRPRTAAASTTHTPRFAGAAPLLATLLWTHAQAAIPLAGFVGVAHASEIAKVTTRYAEISDKTLAYLDIGQGPAVVVVHGVGGHKEDWKGVAEALAKTHRVIAVDMLGFGQSSKVGDDLSMPVQAAAIAVLLDQLGLPKASLVGNSVGGWVAATFAAKFPERTEKLVLIDAAGFRAMFEGTPPVNFDPGSAEEMDKLIHFVINSAAADAPGLAKSAYEAYVASGEKAISATWGKSLYVSPRLEDLFGQIHAPTVVIWGRDDWLFPSALAGAFASQIAGARAELIPDAGHFPQIDQPAATLSAIAKALD